MSEIFVLIILMGSKPPKYCQRCRVVCSEMQVGVEMANLLEASNKTPKWVTWILR